MPDSGVPDSGGAACPEPLVRRVRGEVADDRELAPAVRVRVDGLAVLEDAALVRPVEPPFPEDAALVRAIACSAASTSRCCAS